MNIVSFNVQELEPEWTNYHTGDNTRFVIDPKKKRFISKLSEQYNNYKGAYEFSSKFKSMYLKVSFFISLACALFY